MTRKILLGGIAAMALGAAFALPAQAGAILDNGTIQIGVNDEGHLNTPFAGDPLGIGFMGLRYKPTGAASTEPGCQCEGWGVSNGTISGGANVSSDSGAFGLTLTSFTSTDGFLTNAKSVVNVGGVFEVSHDYHPSLSDNLFQVDVTIKNISGSDQTALYRRVMDWDIYPTPFSEFVTIVNSSPVVFRTDTNGFNSANPLSFSTFVAGPSASNGYTNIIDLGPSDHGALFDFNFGTLLPDATQAFTTFYGAAANEAGAISALALVGAENVYSLGKCNPSNPACTLPEGAPNTFIFAFKGVGGTVVTDHVPEPATLTLLGAGLAGIGAMVRRRKAA